MVTCSFQLCEIHACANNQSGCAPQNSDWGVWRCAAFCSCCSLAVQLVRYSNS